MLEPSARSLGVSPPKYASSTLQKQSAILNNRATPKKQQTPLNNRRDEKSRISTSERHGIRPKTPQTPLTKMMNSTKKGGKEHTPSSLEDMMELRETLDEFKNYILNFDVEGKCIESILHLDEQERILLQNVREGREKKLAEIKEKENELQKLMQLKIKELRDIESRFIIENSQNGTPIKYLKETEDKRKQTQTLKKQLEDCAIECFKIYQKNIALQQKLVELKVEMKRKSDLCRLSYEFIQSTSRFKITAYDGKQLSGYIIPRNSTAKNSHMFELDIGEDNIETSDWLWEKIDSFSIVDKLPKRFLN